MTEKSAGFLHTINRCLYAVTSPISSVSLTPHFYWNGPAHKTYILSISLYLTLKPRKPVDYPGPRREMGALRSTLCFLSPIHLLLPFKLSNNSSVNSNSL